ncbi:MAG TPA: multicopper oxidase domain-containing protein [Chloroflexota bacterium]|nr:multicopper oxidase domain-containing protein [Chloroflexota bacterium]
MTPGVRLFLTSFLALYAELLCIRWVPAYLRFVSYFTNFILLASFLGLGAGILAARRGLRVGLGLFSWLLLAVAGLVVVARFELRIASAGVLYYGASESGAPPAENWIVLPAAFLLVSVLFLCVGRELGTLLAAVTPPLRAYALDVGGSIAGTAAFFLLALTQQPPVVWFGGLLAIVLALALPSVRRVALVAPPLVASLVVAYAMGSGYDWSPYYRVGLTPVEHHPTAKVLTVNSIGHQIMGPADEKEPFYYVPYQLLGDLGAFERVMVIGAGSGSDVSVSLKYGNPRAIDAVEIDPAIARLGRQFHPDRPYDDSRVTVHVDDGRSFLRKTPYKYDLIIFALPDSLTLTSQLSSLRLESFLFTRQSMAEARDRLTPNGVLTLYNFYRETWLLRKIGAMMEDAFGAPPYVVSYGGWGRAAVLMNGPRVRQLVATNPDAGKAYQEHVVTPPNLENDPDAVWLPVIGSGILRTADSGGFVAQPWQRADAVIVDQTGVQARAAPSVATDDWPLMYLPRPGVPDIYLAGLLMVAVVAVGLVAIAGGRQAVSAFNPQMFFLGAAFMLLETRSLVTFGLLFGNTWLVSSLVFFAILCSVLLAIFVGARFSIRPSLPTYALLLAALVLAYALPEDAFLSLDAPALRYAAASLVAFLPIFLANLVFAGSFKLTGKQADVAFASNLLGIMVGGMMEYAALVWGYRHLLLLAILFYALSAGTSDLSALRRLLPGVRTRAALATSALVVAALLLAGCGGAAPTPVAVTAQAFRYQPSTLEWKAGQPVALTLRNPDAVEHDFIVDGLKFSVAGRAGAHVSHPATGSAAPTPDPDSLHVHATAFTETSLTFTPLTKGTYTVYCSLPGHKEAGMTARLVVS